MQSWVQGGNAQQVLVQCFDALDFCFVFLLLAFLSKFSGSLAPPGAGQVLEKC